MKKFVFALLAVFAMSVMSCGGGHKDVVDTDSTEVATDSTEVVVDSVPSTVEVAVDTVASV